MQNFPHHHDFLQTCQRNNFIPDGLQIRKTANIGIYTTDFEEKWSHILNSASEELRDLIIEEFSHAQDIVKREILELETRIANDFGANVMDKFSEKAQEICGKLEDSLAGRRQNKFNKISPSYTGDPNMEVTSFLDREEDQPTESQVGDFIATIRKEVERAQQDIPVIVEDLGAEEDLTGVNSLPIDSPLLLIDLSEQNNNEDMNGNVFRGIDFDKTLTLSDIFLWATRPRTFPCHQEAIT